MTLKTSLYMLFHNSSILNDLKLRHSTNYLSMSYWNLIGKLNIEFICQRTIHYCRVSRETSPLDDLSWCTFAFVAFSTSTDDETEMFLSVFKKELQIVLMDFQESLWRKRPSTKVTKHVVWCRINQLSQKTNILS